MNCIEKYNPLPFLELNECNQHTSLEMLGDHKKTPAEGSVMIGTAAFFNFNAIAARHFPIEKLIIIYNSPDSKCFWNKFSAIMGEANPRKLWHHRLLAYLCPWARSRPVPEKPRKFFIKKIEKLLEDEKLIPQNIQELTPVREVIEDRISWLADDKSFERIRQLFVEKRVEFHQASYTNPDSILKVIESIPEERKVDMLYLSNSREDAVKKKEYANYIASLHIIRKVCTNSTCVIDTIPRDNGCLNLRQRVTMNFCDILKDPVTTERRFPN
ncbi:MAG: hypothetical protein H7A37_05320 [Chlamydiales bacterium]|nr:hypothetical protein [Chlamydiia bacterium]MCP5507699.1 hypothetical protein [Chlamydiales bacterium]